MSSVGSFGKSLLLSTRLVEAVSCLVKGIKSKSLEKLASPTLYLGSLLRPIALLVITTTSVLTSSLRGLEGDLACPTYYVYFITRLLGLTRLDNLEQLYNKLASCMSESKLKSDNKMVIDNLTIMYNNLKLIQDSLKTRNNKVDTNLSEHNKKLYKTEQALEYHSFTDTILLCSLLNKGWFYVVITFVNVILNKFIMNVIMNKYNQSRTSVLWFCFKEVLNTVYIKFYESNSKYLYQTKLLLESDLPFTEIYVGQISRTVILESENNNLVLVCKLGFFVLIIILYYIKQKYNIELVERKYYKEEAKRQEREVREAREAAKKGRKYKGSDNPDSSKECKLGKRGTESRGSGLHNIITSPCIELSDHSSLLTNLLEDTEMNNTKDKLLDSDTEVCTEGATHIQKDSVTVCKGLQVVLNDLLCILTVLQELLVRIVTNQFTYYYPKHFNNYFNVAKCVENIIISAGIELTSCLSDLKDIKEQINKYLEMNFARGEAEHNIASVNYNVINLILKLEQL
ncbi:uncharacterized protein FOMMEDRAFT_136510 [Fomitiporia mediterranea MF3/22]|uniref:uncharacterized protein n=1 Tax=Fomitiporia mediterranea (strain MF3/22) TaxID=694068 RepID=UPI000440748D|nr:uncharacterized protein FOMMEDRAFT_136510 [Fomitiporia mediterranea MF3/22]EJC99561.1 hypothetical protein FOMMEDRAFT_136510 [Fomitiporia mediterranea MF3/22]